MAPTHSNIRSEMIARLNPSSYKLFFVENSTENVEIEAGREVILRPPDFGPSFGKRMLKHFLLLPPFGHHSPFCFVRSSFCQFLMVMLSLLQSSFGEWNSKSSCNAKISLQRAALKRLTKHYFKTKKKCYFKDFLLLKPYDSVHNKLFCSLKQFFDINWFQCPQKLQHLFRGALYNK